MPRPHQWSEKQAEEIVRRYQAGASLRMIARLFHVHQHSITLVLRKASIPRRQGGIALRKLTVNHRYFQHIDTAEKAYWLGVFVADGGISTGNRVSVNLSIRDREHLKKLRQALHAEHEVKTYGQSASLTIRSPELVSDLHRLGVRQQKSMRETVPAFSNAYVADFWRGIVDGDGSISRKKRGKQKGQLSLTLVGGYRLVEAFQQRTVSLSKSKAAIYFSERVWRYTITGRGAEAVFQWLYGTDCVSLARKKAIGLNAPVDCRALARTSGVGETQQDEAGTTESALLSTS